MSIGVEETFISGVYVIIPQKFTDDRGFFIESYNQKTMFQLGLTASFVQDNHSGSVKNTLRGLHYQAWPGGQIKLIRCVKGEILDVAVDLRPNSPTFRKYFQVVLSEKNSKQVYLPNYIAHGFLVLSDYAEVQYKCSNYYDPSLEKGYAWDDPAFLINWGIKNPILSERDKNNPVFFGRRPPTHMIIRSTDNETHEEDVRGVNIRDRIGYWEGRGSKIINKSDFLDYL